MSERQVVIRLSESRARMLREGISRNRFFINGYFAAGGKDYGVSIIENTLIQLQIEFDRAFVELSKKKVK